MAHASSGVISEHWPSRQSCTSTAPEATAKIASMSKRRKYQSAALLLGVAVAASVDFGVAGVGQSAAFPFRSVTPAELARGGVEVSAATPPANLPTTAARAASAAHKFQGARVLEVHYARCVDSDKVPKLNEDCWAVSMNPRGVAVPGGPAVLRGGKTTKAWHAPIVRYDLIFVNASSGKIIEGTAGS